MAKPSYPVVLASTSLTSGIVAAWPLNEGVGNAVDVVGGVVLDCSGSGVSWNASPLGLKTVGTPSRATVATPAAMKLFPASQPSMTFLWIGQILGTYADFGICGGVSDTPGYNSYTILGKTSTGHVLYGCGNGFQDGSASFVSGAAHQIELNQTVGVLTGYFDGVSDGARSNNLTGGISYSGTSVFCLGSPTSGSAQTNVRHDLAVVWNRALTSGERTALNSDPWQLFVPAPSGANPAALLPAM